MTSSTRWTQPLTRCLLAVWIIVGCFLSDVHAADPTPIQQRIALVPNGMTVSWSTVGPINVTATVAWGTSPTTLTSTASGVTYNYNPSITWFHHVTLYGLAPSTTYYWRVTSPVGVNSSVLSFVTAPPVGDRTPYNISINGDMGIFSDNGTLIAMQQALPNLGLFWHIGDLSYADDWPYFTKYFPGKKEALNASYEKITESWMTSMTPLWNQKPYMVLPGNHEATVRQQNSHKARTASQTSKHSNTLLICCSVCMFRCFVRFVSVH